MTPQDALQLLHSASERALLNGQDRDSVRQAVNVLNEAITPKPKATPKAKKTK